MSACPDEEHIVEFVQGRLSDGEARALEAHIDECPACRELLAHCADQLLEAASEGAPDGERPAPAAILPAGARVGRYIVLHLVGTGAMGTVYAVYDPELNRRVALKLLRGEGRSGAPRSELRSRLLREAQAMARLSHPNVVPVHDVGTAGDEVFISMDYIDGVNLRTWLTARRRGWEEILRVFVGAGRGLAAAHRAGLVHRDFKPDNVLLDKSGRVCVTDFGLARSVAEVGAGVPMAPGGSLEESPLVASLTRTGTTVGTPAYMAPEQIRGEESTPSADQFSFCVGLYEALYGGRPFEGATVDALRAAAQEGRVREAPKGSRVPAWLRPILLRGLSGAPEQRFASLDALLAALERDPRARRRRAVFAVAAGAVLLGILLFLRYGGEPGPLCTGADVEIARVWGEPQKRAVQAAFAKTAVPYAAHAWGGVSRLLDAYSRAWSAVHVEACEATRLRGHQSEELLDRRMECLGDRREELAALVDLFAQADGKVVEKSVQAASSLGRIDGCSAAAVLRRRMERPLGEDLQQGVAAVRRELAKAQALLISGKNQAAVPIAQAAAARARSLQYEPLEAEALYLLGRLYVKQKESYESALRAALAGGHDEIAARALLGLAWFAAVREARFDEAEELTRRAQAVIRRLGGPVDLSATRSHYRGIVAHLRGDYPRAVGEYQDAVRLREKLGGSTGSEVVNSLSALGRVNQLMGRYDAARAAYERAIAIGEEAVGRDHPLVGTVLGNLGTLEDELANYESARQIGERALAINERAYGPYHPFVASVAGNLGIVLGELGEYGRALKLHERVLAIAKKHSSPGTLAANSLASKADIFAELGRGEEAVSLREHVLALRKKALPPNHSDLSHTYAELARAMAEVGRAKEALPVAYQGLRIAERASGMRGRQWAIVLHGLGAALFAGGRHFEALDAFRRALAAVGKVLPPAHPELAIPLVGMGETLLALQRDGRQPLTRALGILEPRPGHKMLLARARFASARALWSANGDRARARALAEKARQAFADPKPRRAAEVDAWLASHR
jgi:tetratricopeptide (TPR) repeat protein